MCAKIFIVEGTITKRHSIEALLASNGLAVISFSKPSDALHSVRDRRPSLIILDASQEQTEDRLALVEQIRSVDKEVPVILIADYSSEALLIQALRLGVSDYFKLPLMQEGFVASIKHWLKRIPPADLSPVESPAGCGRLVGRSASIEKIERAANKAAQSDSNVLITGDTGTGKELVAELLHRNGRRHDKQMVCINCAAIPDSLLESELFGYEKGAFTGAHVSREGKLEQADGGTIFLDEIGDLSAYSQAKILRAIETREVQRLGAKRNSPVNIRVIAATNHSLEDMVVKGEFRQDLFFRLNVVRLHLPPLRERKEDIPLLCEHFIRELNPEFGLSVRGLSEEVVESLLRHVWSGNVRELRNVIEVAFINRPLDWIRLEDLPESFLQSISEEKGKQSKREHERDKVLSALLATSWNKSKAAEKLSWSRMTLYRKMEKYQIKTSKEADYSPSIV